MVLFRKELLALVLQGRKTQTRRLSSHHLHPGRTYQARAQYSGPPQGLIKIKRRFEQRLGDMTEEEARAEGAKDLADFPAFWKSATKKEFDPNQVVTAYEFELAEK